MIEKVFGNIFDSDCKVLVNAVNSFGSMGGGIARQFALRYPEMNKDYELFCSNGGYDNKYTHFYKTNEKIICNLLTVDDNILANESYILRGLLELKRYITDNNINSVAIPLLGAGIGGLNKETSIKLITDTMSSFTNKQIIIYEFKGE